MDCDGDPPEGTRDIEPAPWASAQLVSRVVLATALGLLGLWILHRFLPALAWAAILAIALWPVYRRRSGLFRRAATEFCCRSQQPCWSVSC